MSDVSVLGEKNNGKERPCLKARIKDFVQEHQHPSHIITFTFWPKVMPLKDKPIHRSTTQEAQCWAPTMGFEHTPLILKPEIECRPSAAGPGHTLRPWTLWWFKASCPSLPIEYNKQANKPLDLLLHPNLSAGVAAGACVTQNVFLLSISKEMTLVFLFVVLSLQ